jgi:hypothetical protein
MSVRLKGLKGEARINYLIQAAKSSLVASGAPSSLVSYLEQLWSSALGKTPGKLTPQEKNALVALMYLSNPAGFGRDVRTDSRHARQVYTWLKQTGRDVPGVDTPDAYAFYSALRNAYRKKNWARFEALIKGTASARVTAKARRLAARAAAAAPAKTKTRKTSGRKARKKKVEAAPAETVPTPVETTPAEAAPAETAPAAPAEAAPTPVETTPAEAAPAEILPTPEEIETSERLSAELGEILEKIG